MKTVKTDQSCVYMDFTASFLLRGACLMCMAVLACDGSVSHTPQCCPMSQESEN